MKKRFFTWTVSVILVCGLGGGIAAQQVRGGDNEQKQKVRIKVAEKNERAGSTNVQARKSQTENRTRKP